MACCFPSTSAKTTNGELVFLLVENIPILKRKWKDNVARSDESNFKQKVFFYKRYQLTKLVFGLDNFERTENDLDELFIKMIPKFF